MTQGVQGWPQTLRYTPLIGLKALSYMFCICTRKTRGWHFGPDRLLDQSAQRFHPISLSPPIPHHRLEENFKNTLSERASLIPPHRLRARRHWHTCLALPVNSCIEATELEHTQLASKHSPKCLLDWNLHRTENKLHKFSGQCSDFSAIPGYSMKWHRDTIHGEFHSNKLGDFRNY